MRPQTTSFPQQHSQPDYRALLKRYARYAPRYDRWFARYSAVTLQHALNVIPLEGAHALLDVACGTGLFAAMLKQHRPALAITGVDVSQDMLEKARQRIPPGRESGVQWLQGFAENLPVESEQFDIITCTNAFHLVQDPAAALKEFRRALKPGGTLVLLDWCRDFPIMRLREFVLRYIDRQKRQIRTLSELVELVQSAGFAIQHQERFKDRLWGFMTVVGVLPVQAETQREPAFAGAARSDSMPQGNVG